MRNDFQKYYNRMFLNFRQKNKVTNQENSSNLLRIPLKFPTNSPNNNYMSDKAKNLLKK